MRQTFTHALLFLSLFCLSSTKTNAQVPAMGPIQGASAVCVPTLTTLQYTASATNAPTAYSWSIVGPNPLALVQTGSVCAVFFPATPGGTYTLYCYATNGSGNSSVASFVITAYDIPTVTFSGASSVCQGSSTNLSASATIFQASSTTISYNWSPPTGLSSTNSYSVIATPPSTTNYTVLTMNGPCTATNYVTVTVNSLPTVAINSTVNMICLGEVTTLTLSGATSYLLNGKASPSIVMVSPSASANYVVVGTDGNGCTGTANHAITVNPCTGLNELKDEVTRIDIYPNPNAGSFTIRSTKPRTVILSNELGQVLKSMHVPADSTVEVSGLSPGIYFVTGDNSTKKIVVLR